MGWRDRDLGNEICLFYQLSLWILGWMDIGFMKCVFLFLSFPFSIHYYHIKFRGSWLLFSSLCSLCVWLYTLLVGFVFYTGRCVVD
jgi:hypothetical protein